MDELSKRRTMRGFLVGIIVATAVGSCIGTVRHDAVFGFVLVVSLDLVMGLIFALRILRR